MPVNDYIRVLKGRVGKAAALLCDTGGAACCYLPAPEIAEMFRRGSIPLSVAGKSAPGTCCYGRVWLVSRSITAIASRSGSEVIRLAPVNGWSRMKIRNKINVTVRVSPAVIA